MNKWEVNNPQQTAAVLKKLEGVSDDDKSRAEKELQKLHDDHIAQIETLLKAKEAEIMAV